MRDETVTKPAKRCVVLVGYPRHPRQCSFKGEWKYRGERYCNIHYPPATLARVKQQARAANKRAARAKADAIRKAEQRVWKAASEHSFGHMSTSALQEAIRELSELGWEPKP